MAIPAAAKTFKGAMDPTDLVEFTADASGTDGLLESDEAIDTFTLTLGAEAVALGVGIKTGTGYDALKVPNVSAVANQGIRFYLEVAPEFRADTAFDVGVKVPLTLTITTTSTPPRRRQRTLVVQVTNQ